MDSSDAKPKADKDLSDEELRKLFKPSITADQATEVLRKSFAESGEEVEVVQHLDSYDDVNFKVRVGQTPYLLKIHNGVESRDFNQVYNSAGQDFFKKGCMNSVVHLQTTMMTLLSSNNIKTSKPKTARDTNAPVCIHSLPVVSEKHSPMNLVVRLLSWVEGRLMSSANILPIESLADAGRFLGKVNKVLDRLSLASIQPAEKGPPSNQEQQKHLAEWLKFDHADSAVMDSSVLEPAQRFHQWDGKNTAGLRSFTNCIQDERRRNLVITILDAFQNEIIKSGDASRLRLGVNHGDYNDANILLDDGYNVSGVIDFGDSVQSWRVLDVTVGMAYAMLSTYGKANRGISAAAALLRGYNLEYPLTPLEKKHLVLLVACRLACSVTLGAYSFQQNPENTYLLFHAEPAWKMLEMFWCYDCAKRGSVRQAFARVLDQACLYDGKPGNAISCSDIVLPDPSVADLLAPVRIPSFEPVVEPPSKKLKTKQQNGLPVVTFVTGNQKKLEELIRILRPDGGIDETLPFHLTNTKLDLPELQGDPVDIAKEKCLLAANEVDGAVIIEDTSLCFNALGGMPGPYIKWFLESCGHEGLNKLLQAHEDKTGYAQTVVAFCAGRGKDPSVFVGMTSGKIVMPRGSLDFGWDPIFEPDEGAGKTYAEMTKEEKDAISHRSRALSQMKAYFEGKKEAVLAELS